MTPRSLHLPTCKSESLCLVLLGLATLLCCQFNASAQTTLEERMNALLAKFADENKNTRQAALNEIITFGEPAIPLLILNLSHPELRRRGFAREALVGIGIPAVAAIRPLLDSADLSLREEALIVLRGLGPLAKQTLPKLIQLLDDPTPKVRDGALGAIGALGPEAQPALPVLIRALSESPRPPSKELVLSALGQIGPTAKEAVPAILNVLSKDNDVVRGAAIDALGKIGPAAVEAVPALVQLLQDPSKYICGKAADALGRFGPAASDAAPPLTALIKREELDSQVRVMAANALDHISRADIHYDLVKREIPSEKDGYRHYEISLQIAGAPDAIFLARLFDYTKPDRFTPNYGFDEETLTIEWLNPPDFLHISWRTCKMGQGTNTMQTHLLLQKKGERWAQLYRDTHEFYSREGVFVRYQFKYEPRTESLSIHEEDCSGPNRESHSPPPEPGSSTLTARNVIYVTNWEFKVTEGRLQFIKGTKSADLDDRAFYLYSPESETRAEHAFDIRSVATFLAPKNPEAMLTRLRELNPALKSKDTCSGVVLFDTDVKWRGANEKHYYNMEE